MSIIGGIASKTTTATITSKPDGISTLTPTHSGMIGNCNTFYLVQSRDQCGTIASSHRISLANFFAWNTGITSTFSNLIAADYVCVNNIGGNTSTSTSATSASKDIGITTSTPTQSSMVGNYKTFYLFQSGD
jgi:hypothetical protein